jgi:hypothetical protein
MNAAIELLNSAEQDLVKQPDARPSGSQAAMANACIKSGKERPARSTARPRRHDQPHFHRASRTRANATSRIPPW